VIIKVAASVRGKIGIELKKTNQWNVFDTEEQIEEAAPPNKSFIFDKVFGEKNFTPVHRCRTICSYILFVTSVHGLLEKSWQQNCS